MIRRNKKTRKYHSPQAVVTGLMLESNFCNTNLQFSIPTEVDVDPLENVYDEEEIFEF